MSQSATCLADQGSAFDEVRDRMADVLFRAAAAGRVDLGDERAVDTCLARAGYSPGIILLHEHDALDMARARLQRRASIRDLAGKSVDALCLAAIIGGWTIAYCLLCPPARAAGGDAPVTDESLAGLVSWAPLVMAGLLLLCWLWRERRHAPPPADDDLSLFWSPPPVPDMRSLEQNVRDTEGR